MAMDGSGVQLVTTVDGWRPRYWDWSESYYELEPADAWINTIAWSPDGSMLLYSCGTDVCVVTLDGKAVGRSPLMARGDVSAGWSPDGSRIAVGLQLDVGLKLARGANTGLEENEVLVYTMTPDGTDLRVVARFDLDDNSIVPKLGRSPQRLPIHVDGCSNGSAIADPADSPGLVHDCEALLKLRDELAGTAKLNWSGHRTMAYWDGVGLAGSPLRVHELILWGQGLSGTIPTALGELSELRLLSLSWNYLGGGIPRELAQLTNLRVLSLYSNHISGSIPESLSELSQLRHLSLGGNHFHGEIPLGMRQLSQLEVLHLDQNQLSGSVPVWLGQLSDLRELHLADNQLVGGVPTELEALGELRSLTLWGNQLSGCLPPFRHVENVERAGSDRGGDGAFLNLPDCEWVRRNR